MPQEGNLLQLYNLDRLQRLFMAIKHLLLISMHLLLSKIVAGMGKRRKVKMNMMNSRLLAIYQLKLVVCCLAYALKIHSQF
uniref:Uncharacterized protein n=1 Tax=Rhizophora mucronata TaxID=61149 RepID=A0A2P2IQQ1_RHIMU